MAISHVVNVGGCNNYYTRLVFVTSSYQKAFTGSSTLLSNLRILLSLAMPINHTELHACIYVHARDQIQDTCIVKS